MPDGTTFSIQMALDQVNQMIDDMEAAEARMTTEGKNPGEYNLSAITRQVRDERVEEERIRQEEANRGGGGFQVDYNKTKEENANDYAQYLANTVPGDFTPQDMMGRATTKMEELFDPWHRQKTKEVQEAAAMMHGRGREFPSYEDPATGEKRYVLGADAEKGIFTAGGNRYQMIEYSDAAANQVLFDETGKVAENSPIQVLGENPDGKPIMAVQHEYKGKGITPMGFTVSRETLDPYSEDRIMDYKLKTKLDMGGDPNKFYNIMYNHARPVYGSINEMADPKAAETIKNLQDTGILRASQPRMYDTGIQQPDLSPVSEEEKKARLQYYQRDKTPRVATGMTKEEIEKLAKEKGVTPEKTF